MKTTSCFENKQINPYIDLNYNDRTEQIESAYLPTLEDIKRDPQFYAELVNDLMYHWVYGTRETPLMVMAKRNMMYVNEMCEQDMIMRSLNERHRVASYIKKIAKQDPLKELQKQLK